MWDYMISNKGQHRHDYNGQTVFANVDGLAGPSEDAAMKRAVSKLVRTIIEKNGGDGTVIKQSIKTQYNKGFLWWNGQRVGEWSSDKDEMELEGAAVGYKESFVELCSRI